MVSNLDESEIVYEEIMSQKLSDPEIGMDRGSPKASNLSHREDLGQGEGNDAANSVPVANPIVSKKKKTYTQN
ncbi:hypothetical protein CsSME_00014097 [Camellia sinensis var. sinensis]